MTPLTRADIVRQRMANLLLTGDERRQPVDVVTWLGAMQAQDLGSGKWSFGVRLPGQTETTIDDAIAEGQVLRTWPMRGTIHFVPPRDARWMLETTGIRMLSGVRARWDYLGLDKETVDRSAAVLDDALKGGTILTRGAAMQVLTEAGIDVSGQRAYHVIWYASQIGVTCLGPQQGKEQTIVRLADWAPDQVQRDASDGMRELALRYVQGHGPVTHQDFARWAGIGATEAKKALTANDGAVRLVDTDEGPMWVAANDPPGEVPGVVALPGFDEFILGYKDRSLVLPEEHKGRIVPGNNGVFRPTVVVDGNVVATWRRKPKARVDDIDVEAFVPLRPAHRRQIESSFDTYATYLGRELRIRIT